MNITFLYSTNSVVLPAPIYGYTSIVTMAISMARAKNGAVIAWDNLAANDFRTLTAKWRLTETEMTNLHSFLDNVYGGRCNEFAISLGSGSGFYPFGPDKGDANSFLAYEIKNERSGRQLRPYDRYWFDGEFLMTLAPSYSLPSRISEGSFTIGTITGLPFPTSKPAYFKSGSIDITNGGQADVLDNGISACYSDAEITIETNQSNIAAVVNYLCTTARANTFTINTPSNSNVFGAQNGDGSFSVKLISNKITVEHGAFNLFKLSLMVTKV